MAHYDSVEMAPGAGDDGAAVAAILETTRALVLDAPFKNSVMLIFTDGEEAGLRRIQASGWLELRQVHEDGHAHGRQRPLCAHGSL